MSCDNGEFPGDRWEKNQQLLAAWVLALINTGRCAKLGGSGGPETRNTGLSHTDISGRNRTEALTAAVQAPADGHLISPLIYEAVFFQDVSRPGVSNDWKRPQNDTERDIC